MDADLDDPDMISRVLVDLYRGSAEPGRGVEQLDEHLTVDSLFRVELSAALEVAGLALPDDVDLGGMTLAEISRRLVATTEGETA